MKKYTLIAVLAATASLFMTACSGESSPTPHDEPIIRLFYYGPEFGGGDKQGEVAPLHKIYSATSSDGISFTEEEGVRFEKENITDPDVFAVPGQYVMFTSIGSQIAKATSETAAGTYAEDTSFNWNNGAVCSTSFIGDKFVTFYCSGNNINYAFYNTDTGELEQVGTALTNPFADGMICDPTVIRALDGTYIMYYKYAPSEAMGPMQHKIYYATSPDGFVFTDSGVLVKDEASVPGAIMIGGKIYLYYVDGPTDSIAVGISEDGGATFAFQAVTIEGQSAAKAWDPDPIPY
jgi:hypothetical protein